jgi:hypothetical protein
MLNPVDRLFLLPPSLTDVRERLLLDERLERFAERLRLLERLVDRDDGMLYILNTEKKRVG